MRSKAEVTFARWLREHKIRYAYEVYRYVLPSGEGYLPDFWLPDVGTFIEVKAGNVDGLHKPWVLAHVVDREEGLRLYVWSYGRTWRSREFGWSPDVVWVRCQECDVTYPSRPPITSCRGCGGSRLAYVPVTLERSRWRRRDPMQVWRPSEEDRRHAVG